MSALRICAEPGCKTQLSRYNAGTHCWPHTLDLCQTERPAPHLVRRHTVPTNRMSQQFLANVPGAYDVTYAEAAEWISSVIEDVMPVGGLEA